MEGSCKTHGEMRNDYKRFVTTECSRVNTKHWHRLMASTKKEIGCGPDSSGVVSLVEGGGSCGRSNHPSREKKSDVYLRITCIVYLFTY